MWGIIILILIVLILVYFWWKSDARKRERIRETFKKGARCAAEVATVINDLGTLNRPHVTDYVRVAATLRDRAHIEGTQAHNVVTVRLFQAGLGAILPPTDEDMEVAYILHQIIDAGAVVTPELVNAMDGMRDRDLATRLAVAKQGSTSRAETANVFLDNSQVYTTAPQNVHDSSVNNDLRETLTLIAVDNPNMGAAAAINEAREQIKLYKDATRRAKANATLQKIVNNESCSTFANIPGVPAREADIFALVWSRCDHPQNETSRTLMREAICTALVDAIEQPPVHRGGQLVYEPVCINGRIARLIGSLTLLDFDPRVGAIMTYEAYRNQILEETKKIFNVTMEDFENGTEEQKQAAVAFEEGKDEEAKILLETLDKKIEDNLAFYKSKMTALDLNNVRTECKAYLAV